MIDNIYRIYDKIYSIINIEMKNSENLKDLVESLKVEIIKANNILLHCHPSPDPDSVGSSLAMKFALEQIGKKVTLIKGDSDIPKAFEFPGVDTITKKSYSEINISEFDLFIILDSGSLEMISKMPIPTSLPDTLMTVVIDHHASNIGYAKLNIIRPEYPATAQLLYDIFKILDIKVDRNIALNLFMGIYTDTGGFRYENTNIDTFKIASELVSIAPDYYKTISVMENSKRYEALVFEGLALSSVKTFYDGILAVSCVSNDDLIKNNIINEDISTGYISGKLKSVLGIYVSATIIEVEKNVLKISFRTSDSKRFDVSKLAIALGGGGHIAAAGATFYDSPENAMKILVQKAKEIYNL